MFAIFKKKPKYSLEELFNQLGTSAKQITEVASGENDLEVALKGIAVVNSILINSKKFFGLKPKPNSIFARYLIAFDERDFTKIAEMIRNMADALSKVSDIKHKGALIYFWLNGND